MKGLVTMSPLFTPISKPVHRVIGLMSGTCTDGIDAALVDIQDHGLSTRINLLSFITIPYEDAFRKELLSLASGHTGGSYTVSKTHFLLGHLFAEACKEVCLSAGVTPDTVDFIGSHGHTIYHQPIPETFFSHLITSTLQIGEPSVINEQMNCPVVSDFRVRDMSAGGLGAPLVPYTEYLLYGEPGNNIALQNIGGIGNITYLPASGRLSEIMAFDTGPGNMLIDSIIEIVTKGHQHFDNMGAMAAKGSASDKLMDYLLNVDYYIHQSPPKTTGREYYGSNFVNDILSKASSLALSSEDILATVTLFTAKTITLNIRRFLPNIPQKLIVGGGGSYNYTLMNHLKELLPECRVITNEDIGLNSSAKEAIAFAVLANETLHFSNNNVPSATGALHPVIMGKISL